MVQYYRDYNEDSANKIKKRIIIYARKSRVKDDETLAIERQIELLENFAISNNMEYVVFKEEASSEDWNRIEFQKMLIELKSQLYDGVLVTEQDRISRDAGDFNMFKRFCKEQGLTLYTLTRSYNFFNDDDDFVSGIQAEIDAQVMRITKRKLYRGRIQALEKGRYFGKAPIGYKRNDNKDLIIDEENAKIIKMIFNLYTETMLNQREICDKLNLLGYRTNNGKEFTPRATSIILKNEIYIGTVKYNPIKHGKEIIVKNAHPAIVSTDTFNKAQVIMAKNRKVPQDSRKGKYLLSKLIKCPICQTTLSFDNKYNSNEAKRTLDKDKRDLYISNCIASMNARKRSALRRDPNYKPCKNFGMPALIVEKMVINDIMMYYDKLDKEAKNIINHTDDNTIEVKSQIDLVKEKIKETESQVKRVNDAIIFGTMTPEEAKNAKLTIKERRLLLESELVDLEEKFLLNGVDKVKEKQKKIRELLSCYDKDVVKANQLLREIIECVYYLREGRDANLKTMDHMPKIVVVYKN